MGNAILRRNRRCRDCRSPQVDIGNFTDYRPSSIALTTVAAPLIVVTVPEALLVE